MNLWVKLTDNPTWNHIFSMGTDKNHYALLATVGNPYGTPVGLTMGINNGSGEYRVAAAPADTVLPGSWETSLHPIGGTNADYPQSEGPNWAKSYADGKYYIYTDEFTGGVTYYSNDDITDDYGWEYRQAGEGSMAPDKVPNLDYADQLVSHCGLISVTQKEIDHLVEYWGVTSVEKGIFFTVLDAENPEAVTVTVGTAAEDLELPQTVRVQYDDGGWRDVTVAWDTTSYQPTEGTYTLTGAITLAEDVKNPDGAVTRAMVWTVLARMAGEDTDGGATWYSKAQIWATETGLINGINGYLKPQSGATRAQLATMLMRFTA